MLHICLKAAAAKLHSFCARGRLQVKFSGITWTHDNQGVFYGCYPDHEASHVSGTDTKSHENQKLFYHRFCTRISLLKIIFKLCQQKYAF